MKEIITTIEEHNEPCLGIFFAIILVLYTIADIIKEAKK